MNGPNTPKSGSFYGKRGNDFERYLVKELNDKTNLDKLKKNKLTTENVYRIILHRVSKDNKIKIKNITNIAATNSLPQLINRGHPKTDIYISLETSTKKTYIETFSLKNTNKNRVSCHDYPAKDFIRVLKCEQTRLADYLNLFQQFPTYRSFEANLEEGYSSEEFTELLTKKSNILTEWALKGRHDKNLVNPILRISKYLLISGTNKLVFYSMDEYISIIRKRTKHRFGVPFSWTYPSKQRGKRIQLKLPIFFE